MSLLVAGTTALDELLATNKMGDRVYATPAISDGVLYVRTHSALFAFGAKQK